MEMVPQLLERNLDVPRNADVQVTVGLQQAGQQGHRRRPQSQVSARTHRYVVEETLTPSHA